MTNSNRDQKTKVHRAWNNKLKGINNLLFWMYETDVLNKGEKAKKDSIFRQYTRYYNDGDAPRGVLTKYKVGPYDTLNVELKLEQYLEDFICLILNKYRGKYDKTEYLEYMKNERIEKVASRIDWGYVPDNLDIIKDSNLIIEINEFIICRDAHRETLLEITPKFSSYTTSYIIENTENISDDILDEYAIIESRKNRLVKKIRELKTITEK